jgi:diaminohydroxyphosphoribosylaminopyrimidine deaminase/5-amino-6-(5-phosphoribosylamino)uracil reductase
MNSKESSTDENFMKRAIQLAKLGGSSVFPNPLVGAVIVYNNQIIGEGYHQLFGEAHAEINAINSVENKELIPLSTIYVTLEPCAHFGKTPPCANRLVLEKFKRVVVACKDPFSKVAGKGFETIQNAGIDLTIGVCENEAIDLNKRFFTFHQKKRPFVILKWAESIDGFIDFERVDDSSHVNWISSPSTQVLTHKWRTQEAAILVGWKTIQNDNPSLTSRAFTGNNPLRIILDPNNRLEENFTVFTDNEPVYILTKEKELTKGNNHWIKLNDYSVKSILNFLYSLNILSVIIEGGSTTHQLFINDNLWDEARIIIGNKQFKKGTKAAQLNNNFLVNELEISTDIIKEYVCLN